MEFTLQLNGLTCNNCAAKAKSAIESINTDIVVEKIDFTTGKVTYKSQNKLPINSINSALAKKGSYEVVEGLAKKEKKISVLPLVAIISTIALAAYVLNYFIGEGSVSSFMFDYMGLFLMVFSIFKLLDLKGFQSAFARYDPVAKLSAPYGFIYPFIELGLGISFLTRVFTLPALAITMVLLSFTTYGVIKVLTNKQSIQCACLGNIIKLPMTTATLIENVIMLGMAATMIIRLLL